MGEFVLKITRIEMKATPQSGTWRAGVEIKQVAERDNSDAWHGGETEFGGASAVLPVNLTLSGLEAGEQVELFIGLDDDAEDAGSSDAEDQFRPAFKVFPSGTAEKTVHLENGNDWNVFVHYTLKKE